MARLVIAKRQEKALGLRPPSFPVSRPRQSGMLRVQQCGDMDARNIWTDPSRNAQTKRFPRSL